MDDLDRSSGSDWTASRDRPAPPLFGTDIPVPLGVEHTFSEEGLELHVRVHGELDIATHHELQAGLSRIDFGDAAVVRLHLAGLTFCDARGGRLLLRFLAKASRRGLLVSIEEPEPPVRRVLALVDPDSSLIT